MVSREIPFTTSCSHLTVESPASTPSTEVGWAKFCRYALMKAPAARSASGPWGASLPVRDTTTGPELRVRSRAVTSPRATPERSRTRPFIVPITMPKGLGFTIWAVRVMRTPHSLVQFPTLPSLGTFPGMLYSRTVTFLRPPMPFTTTGGRGGS